MKIHTTVRPNQAWSGETMGILVLGEAIPRVPGSAGNANLLCCYVHRKLL